MKLCETVMKPHETTKPGKFSNSKSCLLLQAVQQQQTTFDVSKWHYLEIYIGKQRKRGRQIYIYSAPGDPVKSLQIFGLKVEGQPRDSQKSSFIEQAALTSYWGVAIICPCTTLDQEPFQNGQGMFLRVSGG